MSFEAYILFIAGDMLGLIFTLALTYITIKRNKEGQRIIKILKVLSGILVIVGLVITAVYCISSRNQKITDFQQQIYEADFDLENQNFLAAAEHYDQARLIAYNEETTLQATYSKAMCYFLYGMYESDSDYYRQALKIYGSILENESYKDFDYYIDSIADVSQIYCFLHRKWDEPEWVEMITWLESTAEETSDEEKFTYDELSLRMKVVYTLGSYYEYASYANFENFLNEDISAKALRYYDEFIYLCDLNATGKVDVTPSYIYTSNILKVADFMFVYGIASAEPVNYISKAIELCQTEVGRLNASDVSISDYIELKKNIGKGYVLLGELLVDKEIVYRSQAYEVLSPLITMDDKNAQTALMNVGYYLVRTNMCSDLELDRVVDIYQYNLAKIPFETDASRRISVLTSACVSCKWIVENYSYRENAMEAGAEFSTELMTQRYDFLTEEQRAVAEDFQDFFVKHEEQNTNISQNETKPTEQQTEKGYQISVSASRVDLYQQFVVTVIPTRSDFTNIVLYAKDPLGGLWDFTLGTSTTKALLVDRLDLTGVWTIYAEITYNDGTYSGEQEGPYVQMTVESGMLGDLLNSLGT